MNDAGPIGYQLPQELVVVREQVRRIIQDEIIPAESRVDPDAAEILEEDYWTIAKRTQAAGMWCMGSPPQYGGGGLGTFSDFESRQRMVSVNTGGIGGEHAADLNEQVRRLPVLNRQQRLVSLDVTGDLPEPAAEPLPPVDPAQLQQALNELPEVFRTPVIMFYFEEFSYKDIAEQMDLHIFSHERGL